ncbi:hypothetical protein LIER_43267 [Lithospermum erythrorhizon]|uniref:Reverse transcriptase Ty1/copia-type domain-containing protein n=1 Tax=Lithospermum erythrorhizon TaxID=34254 RepID=A0AAV3PRU4_LITER
MDQVERRHRHIVDTGLTLLAHAGLDFKYWQYAFQIAVFLINRIPSSLDIQNGVLNGDLTEAVYMQQLPGFASESDSTWVCKLNKYLLKQAPRAWFDCLQTFLTRYGFTTSKADSSLFIYRHGDVSMFMLVYVHDIIVTGSHVSHVNQFISTLSKAFVLRDLGDLDFYLGISLTKSAGGSLFLSQRLYC